LIDGPTINVGLMQARRPEAAARADHAAGNRRERERQQHRVQCKERARVPDHAELRRQAQRFGHEQH